MINATVLLVGVLVTSLCTAFLAVTTSELRRLGREFDERVARQMLESGASNDHGPASTYRTPERVTPTGKRLKVA